MRYRVPIEVISRNRHHIKYLEELKNLAKRNRRRSTDTEGILWKEVLSHDRTGYRFLRQKPLGKYIADFYCSKLRLIIEVDGDSHKEKQYIDSSRDEYFRIRNIWTIRIKNKEVLNDVNKAKELIHKEIRKREIDR